MAMRSTLLASVGVVLALVAGAADARGQLQARQTSVELVPGSRSGRLVLANAGDTPVAAQIRLYGWTIENDEDQLAPSNALTVSPPIVEIPANGEQLIRLVRTTDAAPAREEAYRVVVDELPGDPVEEGASAVKVRMRYLIPLFVRVADPAPVALRCQADAAMLTCTNTGGRAAQLGASRLLGENGRNLELTKGLLGYILAGGTRRFPIPASAQAGTWSTFEVRLNGTPESIALRAP